MKNEELGNSEALKTQRRGGAEGGDENSDTEGHRENTESTEKRKEREPIAERNPGKRI